VPSCHLPSRSTLTRRARRVALPVSTLPAVPPAPAAGTAAAAAATAAATATAAA